MSHVGRLGEAHREFWAAWFGYASGREVLVAAPTKSGWTRAWLEDPGLFMEHVARCEEVGWPCYMSVNTYGRRGRIHALDRLFWDFDSKEEPPDLDAAWRDARRLHDTLEQLHHVRSLIVASGMKGYHVHAFLSTSVTVEPGTELVAKATVRLLQARLIQGLQLPTLDRGVVGDIARLARVPYTIHHPKELKDGTVLLGGLCQPLTPEREDLLLDTSDVDGLRDRGVPIKAVGSAIRSAWLGEEIRRARREKGGTGGPPRLKGVRPCLEALLRRGHFSHRMRVAVVTEYHHQAGLGEDELVALFQGMEDFDEDRARYQVRHILRRGYKPFRCVTLKAAGVCLGDACTLGKRRREGDPG